MSIKVDPEFKALIPPLTPDEYTQLEKNILKDGIRDALIVWPQPNGDDILIDGHNRFEISAAHAGIRFSIRRMEFNSRDDARHWIAKNQLGRRNLDKWEKFDLYKVLEDTEKTSAKERMSDGAKGTPILAEAKGEARDKIAKMIGVSHGTYDKMKTIDQSGDEKLKERVRSGEMSISQGYNAVKVAKAEAEGKIPQTKAQKERKAVSEAEGRRRRFEETKDGSIVWFEDKIQDDEDKKTIANDCLKDIRSATKTLYWAGATNRTAIFHWIRKSLSDDDREELIQRIRDALLVLDAVLTELED